MAETIPGGVYRVGDEFQDANGKPVKDPGAKAVDAADAAAPALAPASPGPGLTGGGGKTESDADADPLWPASFPNAQLLKDAGVKSAADAQGMTRDALIALPGLGPARADAVLAWKAS
jgi:hypothetical protein